MTVNTETGEIVETLTEVEQSRLRVKEAVIERGAQSIGEALRDIRDERLYRQTHGTFEDYCQDRWAIARNYANKQIAAVEVVAVLGTSVPIPEGQARELAPLRNDPDRMRDVWQQANDATNGKPTAAAIREARDPGPEVLYCGNCNGVDSLAHDCPDAEIVDAEIVEDDEPDPKPEPKAEPRAPQRRALTDQFFDAAYDLGKVTERVARLAADDRFPQNAEKVAAKHRSDLLRAIELLTKALDRFPS